MAGKGGKNPRSGRPRRVDEEFARKVCIKAIIEKYTSLEKGIEAILDSKDEKLKVFVWSHALGIPATESKLKVSNPDGSKIENPLITDGVITVNVVRTVHNKDIKADGSINNDSL